MLRHDTQPLAGAMPSPGVLPCVWMSAGLVAFKLCDREGECEGCPFDRAMRSPQGRPPPKRRRVSRHPPLPT
ncbi:MAG TPA: hypothetical protein VF414_21075 [Thermoanaerobaculia bacterium]